jgi:hypothetical protein
VLPHQLILPSAACRRQGHRIDSRPKVPGPGDYEFCYVCSLGYEMAMVHLGDEAEADRFVQSLRT